MAGVAWSVPVIATAAAAPAYAVSCDQAPPVPVTLNRNGTGNTNVQVGTGGVGATARTLTATSTVAGGAVRGSWNLRTNDTSQGMSGWLEFESNARGSAGQSNPSVYQEITLTFSSAVQDLKFDITDLDTSSSGSANNYWDAVAITSPPTRTAVLGAALTGSGTLADPWRQGTFDGAAVPASALSNRLTVTFPGPLTTVTFRYWTILGRSSYNGTHAVWVGNMTYKANCT